MTAREIASLLEHPSAAGPVILLAVGPQAQKSGAAAETAIALADAFAARGEDVVLADLSLKEPELHTRLGLSNDEGLSDVFLFGASLPHVTLTPAGHSFKLIPASQFTPDSREVLEHGWWSHVFEEMAQKKAKLLAYLPIQTDGADSFSDRVGTTIILADNETDEETTLALLSPDAEVLNPRPLPEPEPEPVPPPAPASPPARDDEAFEKIRLPKDGARETLIADLRRRQRDALMAPPPAMTPLPYEGGAPTSSRTAPPPDVRPLFAMEPVAEQPKSRAWVYVVLIGLLIIGVGVAANFYWRAKHAAPDRPTAAAPDRPSSARPPMPAQPLAAGQPLPWSVAIASYQSMSQAQERLDQLHAVENTIDFYMGPMLVDGTMNYRVMAGPVGDSAAAASLQDTLIARRIKTGSTGRDVVNTPYAFLLGDFGNRNDAEVTMHAAENKGIPGYIIEAVAQDGSTQYKLYAGAYAGPGDAEFLRSRLKQAGFPDNLVERTGSSRS